jgi:Flp pilus assembly protein TadG
MGETPVQDTPTKARDRRQRSARLWGRRERAQSLVEFALVLPILCILIFGIIDFGMGLRSYISLTNATREGARFGAVGNPAGSYPADCNGTTNTSIIGRVCVSIEGLNLDDIQSVSVSYPGGQSPGEEVIVSAEYTYNFITPIGDLITFFTGGAFPETLTLSTSTNMRLE